MAAKTLRISLGNDKIAIIDEADWPLVSDYRWRAVRSHKTWYAIVNPKPHYTPTLMHRLILELKAGERCDHENHNGLDNRRENLRVCSHSQNMANNCRAPGKHGFKGIAPNGRRWRAFIGGDNAHLGTFDTPELAAAAYDKAATAKFGSFAVTNASLGLL